MMSFKGERWFSAKMTVILSLTVCLGFVFLSVVRFRLSVAKMVEPPKMTFLGDFYDHFAFTEEGSVSKNILMLPGTYQVRVRDSRFLNQPVTKPLFYGGGNDSKVDWKMPLPVDINASNKPRLPVMLDQKRLDDLEPYQPLRIEN